MKMAIQCKSGRQNFRPRSGLDRRGQLCCQRFRETLSLNHRASKNLDSGNKCSAKKMATLSLSLRTNFRAWNVDNLFSERRQFKMKACRGGQFGRCNEALLLSKLDMHKNSKSIFSSPLVRSLALSDRGIWSICQFPSSSSSKNPCSERIGTAHAFAIS